MIFRSSAFYKTHTDPFLHSLTGCFVHISVVFGRSLLEVDKKYIFDGFMVHGQFHGFGEGGFEFLKYLRKLSLCGPCGPYF